MIEVSPPDSPSSPRAPASGYQRGAEALLDSLADWGVERVFVCPGSTEAAFLEASRARGAPTLTMVTHESIGLAAADGYARISNQPGVAYLHANVGLANAIANLSAAELANSPVVILNGLKSTGVQARRGFTTSPYMRDYVRQHVKWAWECLRPEHLAEDVHRALRIATTDPMGPVWLGIAQDVLEASIPDAIRPPRPELFTRTQPDPRGIAAVVDALETAARPLLIAGTEVASPDAHDAVTALSAAAGSPIVMEDRRTFELATLSDSDSSFAGFYDPRSAVHAEADLVLLLGGRRLMEFEQRGIPLPRNATIIQTTSATRYLGDLPGVDMALLGDVEEVAKAIQIELERRDHAVASAVQEWREQVVAAGGAPTCPSGPTSSAHLTVDQMMHALNLALPAECLVVSDATTSHFAVMNHIGRSRPGSLIASSSGSLGWSMGAVIGAQMANPSEPGVAIVGDGVFQFGVQALWTAARESLPTVVVVVNNRSYAAVGAALRRYGNSETPAAELPCKDLSGARPASIAAGFGVHGVEAQTESELTYQMSLALARGAPTVIDVLTDPDDLGPSADPATA